MYEGPDGKWRADEAEIEDRAKSDIGSYVFIKKGLPNVVMYNAKDIEIQSYVFSEVFVHSITLADNPSEENKFIIFGKGNWKDEKNVLLICYRELLKAEIEEASLMIPKVLRVSKAVSSSVCECIDYAREAYEHYYHSYYIQDKVYLTLYKRFSNEQNVLHIKRRQNQ